MPRWAACLIGAIICALIAWLLAPLIPAPGSSIVSIIAWIGCVFLALYAVFLLVSGRSRTL
jgi:hypothetical protein